MRDFTLDDAELSLSSSGSHPAEELIGRAANRILGIPLSRVGVRRHCPHCGASDHGQPLVTIDDVPTDSCTVSFSRVGDVSVAAARLGARTGVDIESLARISRHPVDAVLLHPREQHRAGELGGEAAVRYRAELWVAKEAILKATGDGLRTDPRLLHVALTERAGLLRAWPSTVTLSRAPRLSFFEVSDDIVGALAGG